MRKEFKETATAINTSTSIRKTEFKCSLIILPMIKMNTIISNCREKRKREINKNN
jgi:hypothetical protein